VEVKDGCGRISVGKCSSGAEIVKNKLMKKYASNNGNEFERLTPNLYQKLSNVSFYKRFVILNLSFPLLIL
jgi:hypothetical protein